MEYVCGKLKEEYPEATPLGYDSGANWFITMCEQYNSPYTSATGDHFLFNNETNKTFMTKFKDWFDKGYVTTQKVLGSYTSTKFVEQSSFMSIGSSAGATHQVPTATDGVYPFEVGMAEIPQVDSSNKKVISQGPSLCIFNQGDSQKVLASWLFVKYFTTNTAFQAEFSIASGYVPVLKSVADNEFFKKNTASVGSPLSQNVREGTTNWEIYDVTTGEWSDSGIAIEKDEKGNVTNNPGVDQKSRCSAEAAQLCLKQEDNYFTSPAFLGSSVARTSVENLVTQYLSGQTSDINTAFADAIDYCTNNS
jgi:ABC-type glycerol-3-phosphate transport system substrate-binding protein